MTVAYRVSPGDGDAAVEVEPHLVSNEPPGAYITVTDDLNPSMAVLLNLNAIAELREVLGEVEEKLRASETP